MAATIDTSTVARGAARLNNAKDALPSRRSLQERRNRAARVNELGNVRVKRQRALLLMTTGSTVNSRLNPREILKFIRGNAGQAAEVASKNLQKDAIEALLATVRTEPTLEGERARRGLK